MQHSKKIKADLGLILVVFFWGISFLFIKNVAENVNPMAFLALRFGVAAIFLFLIFHTEVLTASKKDRQGGFLLSIPLLIYMFFQVWALRYTSASKTAFIVSTSVIAVPLLLFLFFRNRPTLSNLAGIFVVVFGIFIMNGGLSGKMNIGDIFAAVSALAVSLHIIMVDIFTPRADNSLALGIWQVIFAALFSTLCWLLSDLIRAGGKMNAFLPLIFHVFLVPGMATSVIITALLCTAVAFVGQVMLQKHTSPTDVALIFTFEPVFALLFAALIPDIHGKVESLSFPKVFGAALICLGALLSQFNLLHVCKVRLQNIFTK